MGVGVRRGGALMRRRIRLADHLGREATVWMVPCRARDFTSVRNEAGEPLGVTPRLKATAETHPEALVARWSDPADLARALIAGDPELDLERTGRQLGASQRIWLDGDGRPIFNPKREQVRHDEYGQVIQSRPLRLQPGNLVPPAPPVWSNVLLARREVLTRYALRQAWQLMHGNSLEYGFLLELARWLDERGQMALVGRGRSGRSPLILTRGARPCLGWLDGRVQGDSLRLVLYLAAGDLSAGDQRGDDGDC